MIALGLVAAVVVVVVVAVVGFRSMIHLKKIVLFLLRIELGTLRVFSACDDHYITTIQ